MVILIYNFLSITTQQELLILEADVYELNQKVFHAFRLPLLCGKALEGSCVRQSLNTNSRMSSLARRCETYLCPPLSKATILHKIRLPPNSLLLDYFLN